MKKKRSVALFRGLKRQTPTESKRMKMFDPRKPPRIVPAPEPRRKLLKTCIPARMMMARMAATNAEVTPFKPENVRNCRKSPKTALSSLPIVYSLIFPSGSGS